MSTVERPGSLGHKAFTAGGSITSDVYVAGRSDRVVAVFAVADQPGTIQPFRIDQTGERRPLALAAAVVAGTESRIVVDFPFGALEVEYTNTNATAGAIRFEVRATRAQ